MPAEQCAGRRSSHPRPRYPRARRAGRCSRHVLPGRRGAPPTTSAPGRISTIGSRRSSRRRRWRSSTTSGRRRAASSPTACRPPTNSHSSRSSRSTTTVPAGPVTIGDLDVSPNVDGRDAPGLIAIGAEAAAHPARRHRARQPAAADRLAAGPPPRRRTGAVERPHRGRPAPPDRRSRLPARRASASPSRSTGRATTAPRKPSRRRSSPSSPTASIDPDAIEDTRPRRRLRTATSAVILDPPGRRRWRAAPQLALRQHADAVGRRTMMNAHPRDDRTDPRHARRRVGARRQPRHARRSCRAPAPRSPEAFAEAFDATNRGVAEARGAGAWVGADGARAAARCSTASSSSISTSWRSRSRRRPARRWRRACSRCSRRSASPGRASRCSRNC